MASEWKRTSILVLTLGLANTIAPHATGREITSDREICEQELSNSFASAYRAGKTTASALNSAYTKMDAEERSVAEELFFQSKSEMVKVGVAFIGSSKLGLRERVSCYIGAYKKVNAGFINGFGNNLTKELKAIYITVPLLSSRELMHENGHE